jgi:hypothetical protein
MSSKLPAKRSHSDLVQWLGDLGMDKRRADFLKNISTAMADGVLVAEIIHSVYPKLIQLHNYYETHSTQSRKTNWLLLNKKVLKHIRCEATDIEIETFIKRQSQDDCILFLRNLKARLPAYEPLYLSGHYELKQPSKRLSTTPRTDRTQPLLTQMNSSLPPPPPPSSPPPPLNSTRSTSYSSQSSSLSTSTTGSTSQPNRRASTIMSEKILANKKKNAMSVQRRASLLTPKDMDQMYSTLASNLKSTSLSMSQQSEELDQRCVCSFVLLHASCFFVVCYVYCPGCIVWCGVVCPDCSLSLNSSPSSFLKYTYIRYRHLLIHTHICNYVTAQ